MLAGGCPDVKIDEVKQVALGSRLRRRRMLAGRLHYAVLHLDDLAEIQHAGQEAATSCWR